MDFSNLRNYLDGLIEKQFPGVDCVVHVDQKEVFRHQSGFADLENKIPMTGDRTYFIYSATKVITAAAGLMLYERGKFQLSDPVYDYLPAFRDICVKTAEGDVKKAENTIRIQDLFTMTAGIAYDYKAPSIVAACQENPDGCTTAQIIDAIAKEPLLYEPGTNWNYSFSLDVIGRLIEVVSGKSFGTYLQEHIFDPLGMKDTGFASTPERLRRMTVPYSLNKETGSLERGTFTNYLSLGENYESGGAGLISTVDDMIRFGDAMCCGGIAKNGERILNSDTIALMQKNYLEGEALKNFWWYADGYGYGLGVRTLIDKAKTNTRSSIGEFGWYGACGSWITIDPQRKLAMYYAQHRGPSDSHFVQPELREWMYYGVEQA